MVLDYMDHETIRQKMAQCFGGSEELIRIFQAPARINVIGEHVDYLGGEVLPAAIDFHVYLGIRKNHLPVYRLHSLEYHSTIESAGAEFDKEHPWANYVLGVVSELQKVFGKVPGFDLVIGGNIPQGAGLSSSAAVEVCTGFALSEVFGYGKTKPEIAQIGQAAENNFVGVNCGIMDQFAIAMGKKGQCMSIDTSNLNFEYFPLSFPEHELFLVDSSVKHSLKDSEYNTRRKECESALAKLQNRFPDLKNLYRAERSMLDAVSLTPEENRRAKHVISERSRTESMKQALKEGDIVAIGYLLYACHDSLSSQFEVSCLETDFIVEFAKSYSSPGARMIGGGFGGCVLILEKQENIVRLFRQLESEYSKRFGVLPKCYRFGICDGVGEFSLENR